MPADGPDDEPVGLTMGQLLQLINSMKAEPGTGTSGRPESEFKMVWKGITLPTISDGADYPEWNFKFKTACGAAHELILDLVTQAEFCAEPASTGYTDPRQWRAARSLYNKLAECTKDSALVIVQSVNNQDGFEAYRRMARRWGTLSVGDQFARLTSLLQASFASGDFTDDLMKWERGLEQYERQTGDKLPDSIRIAKLLGQAPESLRNHLMLTTSAMPGTNSDKWIYMKKITVEFLRANPHPTPMDIGNINNKDGGGRAGGPRRPAPRGSGQSSRATGTPGRAASRGTGRPERAAGEEKGGHCGRCGRRGHHAKHCVAKTCPDGKPPYGPPGKAPDRRATVVAGDDDEDLGDESGDGDDEPEEENDDDDEDNVGAVLADPDTTKGEAAGESEVSYAFAITGRSPFDSSTKKASTPIPVKSDRTHPGDGQKGKQGNRVTGMMTRPPTAKNGEVPIMIDSGCTKSVCGPNDFPFAPTRTDGAKRTIRVANGDRIKHYGSKTVKFTTREQQTMTIDFDVADVQGPILATERINQGGADVILPKKGDKKGPRITKGKMTTKLVKKSGLVFLFAQAVAGIALQGPAPDPAPATTGWAQALSGIQPLPPGIKTDSSRAAGGWAEALGWIEPPAKGKQTTATRPTGGWAEALGWEDPVVAPVGAEGPPRGGDILPTAGDNAGDQVMEDFPALERPVAEVAIPPTPSAAEREEHEILHIFKPWCRACVMGRGKNGPCRTIAERTGIPVVQVDYCFGKTQPGEKTVPILCAVDDLYKRTFACWCLMKGSGDAHAVKGLESYLKSLGAPKLVVQCDPENAAARIIQDAAAKVPGCTTRETPRASKGSNGRVERLHAYVEGLTATWRSDLEERYQASIPLEHPIHPWIVRHCAWTKDRYQIDRDDNMTSYERQFERTYASKMLPLGETVMYRYPGPNASKLTGPWGVGIYCGRSAIDDSHIVSTRQRTFTVKTVRRFARDDAHRYDAQLFLAMKGAPWDSAAARSAPDTGMRAAPPAVVPAAAAAVPPPGDAPKDDIEAPPMTAQEVQQEQADAAAHPASPAREAPADVEGELTAPPVKRPRGRPPTRVLPDPSSAAFTPGCSGCVGGPTSRGYHTVACRRNQAALAQASPPDAPMEAGRASGDPLGSQRARGDSGDGAPSHTRGDSGDGASGSGHPTPAPPSAAVPPPPVPDLGDRAGARGSPTTDRMETDEGGAAGSTTRPANDPGDRPPPKMPRINAIPGAGAEGEHYPVPVEPDPNLELLPEVIHDEDDGSLLDREAVQAGVARELAFMKKLQVGEEVEEATLPSRVKIWTGRWCHRRRDDLVRCRYVVRQYARECADSGFACTPPSRGAEAHDCHHSPGGPHHDGRGLLGGLHAHPHRRR